MAELGFLTILHSILGSKLVSIMVSIFGPILGSIKGVLTLFNFDYDLLKERCQAKFLEGQKL